jgi:hypothetical protein
MWNSVLGDLGYNFEGLFGFNPTIEVHPCWFDLNPSRLLYKDVWVIDFHEEKPRFQPNSLSLIVTPLFLQKKRK